MVACTHVKLHDVPGRKQSAAFHSVDGRWDVATSHQQMPPLPRAAAAQGARKHTLSPVEDFAGMP